MNGTVGWNTETGMNSSVALKSHTALAEEFLRCYREAENLPPDAGRLAATRREKISILMEVIVPVRANISAALEDRGLPNVDPTANREPGFAARAAKQPAPLAFDVLTFCPVPLADWQNEVRQLLEGQQERWDHNLASVVSELSALPLRMYPLPFIQCLLPPSWTNLEQLSVPEARRFLRPGRTTERSLSDQLWYLRRPLILWSVDKGGAACTMPLGRPPQQVSVAIPEANLDTLQAAIEDWDRPGRKAPQREKASVLRRIFSGYIG
jgi:hypothetical protein